MYQWVSILGGLSSLASFCGAKWPKWRLAGQAWILDPRPTYAGTDQDPPSLMTLTHTDLPPPAPIKSSHNRPLPTSIWHDPLPNVTMAIPVTYMTGQTTAPPIGESEMPFFLAVKAREGTGWPMRLPDLVDQGLDPWPLVCCHLAARLTSTPSQPRPN